MSVVFGWFCSGFWTIANLHCQDLEEEEDEKFWENFPHREPFYQYVTSTFPFLPVRM